MISLLRFHVNRQTFGAHDSERWLPSFSWQSCRSQLKPSGSSSVFSVPHLISPLCMYNSIRFCSTKCFHRSVSALSSWSYFKNTVERPTVGLLLMMWNSRQHCLVPLCLPPQWSPLRSSISCCVCSAGQATDYLYCPFKLNIAVTTGLGVVFSCSYRYFSVNVTVSSLYNFSYSYFLSTDEFAY